MLCNFLEISTDFLFHHKEDLSSGGHERLYKRYHWTMHGYYELNMKQRYREILITSF